MAFSVDRYVFNIDSSFQQGGAHDFRNFLSRHPHSARWIIASDYNTASKGADHDVYSFALYPVSDGLDALRDALRRCFPRDFKKTGEITREQKRFFRQDLCYCFVFLISRQSKFLRTGDRQADLLLAHDLIAGTLLQIEGNGTNDSYVRLVRKLLNESKKKNFSLYLFERVLILSMLNAYVAAKISLNMPIEILSWFPDSDDMTTYQDSIFNAFTHIDFYALWQQTYPSREPPDLRTIDRRIRNVPMDGLVDELIRVPDFFSAVLSRWRLTRNVLSPPEGAKRPAMRRYIQIMRHWLTENDNIWIANCRLDGEDLKTGRIITAKSPKRLERVQSRYQTQLGNKSMAHFK